MTSLLLNESLDYCVWLEPLWLKVFIFSLHFEVVSFYIFIFSVSKSYRFMFDILIELSAENESVCSLNSDFKIII